MELIEGDNYVFFPKGNYMEIGNIEGAFSGRSCLVGTKRFIFVIPDDWNEFGNQTVRHMTFGAVKEGEKTSNKIAALIDTCKDIEELEHKCKELLAGKEDKRVLELSTLSNFKIYGGIVGQCRFVRSDGKKCSLVAMGAGNKKRFKRFYKN